MRQNRKYSLFQRNGRKWQRISDYAYSLDTARRVFQDRLIASVFGDKPVMLRPVTSQVLHETITKSTKPRLVK